MGCSDCPTANCTCPINCNGPQCPKDQIICINRCINFNIDGRAESVVTLLQGFQNATDGGGPAMPVSFRGSVCVTNEGPDTLTVRTFNEGIVTFNPAQTRVFVPPNSGLMMAFQNVFGLGLFIDGDDANMHARGQVRYEVQQIIKTNC